MLGCRLKEPQIDLRTAKWLGQDVPSDIKVMFYHLSGILYTYHICYLFAQTPTIIHDASLNTVIPRLTKIIRSGITFVSRNFSLSRT